MNLLTELRKNESLRWGDPDNPDDEDAAVHLCKLAADEIERLAAENAALRECRGGIQDAVGLTSELYEGEKTLKGALTLWNCDRANKILRALLERFGE